MVVIKINQNIGNIPSPSELNPFAKSIFFPTPNFISLLFFNQNYTVSKKNSFLGLTLQAWQRYKDWQCLKVRWLFLWMASSVTALFEEEPRIHWVCQRWACTLTLYKTPCVSGQLYAIQSSVSEFYTVQCNFVEGLSILQCMQCSQSSLV